MSNEDISNQINQIYKADIGAIRNLSKLANDLTKNGRLKVPGGLEIDGNIEKVRDIKSGGTIHSNKIKTNIIRTSNIKISDNLEFNGGNNWILNTKKKAGTLSIIPSKDYGKKNWDWSKSIEFNKGNLLVKNNLETLGQTTIHTLYGGKSTTIKRKQRFLPTHGFRSINVNGGHIMFNTGNFGHGFHSNGNRYTRYKSIYTHPRENGHLHSDNKPVIRQLDRVGFENQHFGWRRMRENYGKLTPGGEHISLEI